MRVLVVGSGGREHALVRAALEGGADFVVAAPGNGGIALDAACEPGVRADDVAAVVACARRHRVDLALVGPEAPLVAGLADALREAGIATFGPGAASARLEGSKAFAKRFMSAHCVPTAAYGVFDDADAAQRFVRERGRAMVVKADGLAAGKGVVVAATVDETCEAIGAFVRGGAFGDAGRTVVVEEKLPGDELSLHVLLDGRGHVVLGVAQDHKRLGDGDRGPNTGGMGAYAPVPLYDDALAQHVARAIVEPTVAGLSRDGLAYRGVLFIGLMVHQGRASVLEYNVRFGDPECAVLLARLERGAALALVNAAAMGALPATLPAASGSAVAVVIAAAGYPGAPRRGDAIDGLERANAVHGATVLHAGTLRDGDRITSDGGRVLEVLARGATLGEARDRAYQAVASVRLDGAQFRRDIGARALGAPTRA